MTVELCPTSFDLYIVSYQPLSHGLLLLLLLETKWETPKPRAGVSRLQSLVLALSWDNLASYLRLAGMIDPLVIAVILLLLRHNFDKQNVSH